MSLGEKKREAKGRRGQNASIAYTLPLGHSFALTGQDLAMTTNFQTWDADEVGVGGGEAVQRKKEEREEREGTRGGGGARRPLPSP